MKQSQMPEGVGMTENIVVKETANMGKGMFANKDFRKNEFILYFEGNVVEGEISSFLKDLLDHMLSLGDNKWVYPQSPWMYLNHS